MKVSTLPTVSSLGSGDKVLVQTSAGKTSLAALPTVQSAMGGGAVSGSFGSVEGSIGSPYFLYTPQSNINLNTTEHRQAFDDYRMVNGRDDNTYKYCTIIDLSILPWTVQTGYGFPCAVFGEAAISSRGQFSLMVAGHQYAIRPYTSYNGNSHYGNYFGAYTVTGEGSETVTSQTINSDYVFLDLNNNLLPAYRDYYSEKRTLTYGHTYAVFAGIDYGETPK